MSKREMYVWFSRVALGVILIAWVLFSIINYITTEESMAAMFGSKDWVIVFSLAVVLADLGAFSRAFVDPNKQKINLDIGNWGWTTILFVVWICVTLFDVGLSWVFLEMEMQANEALMVPEQLQGAVNIIPLGIAIMIWAIQFGLVYALTVALTANLRGGGMSQQMSQAQAQAMAQMQARPNRPMPTG